MQSTTDWQVALDRDRIAAIEVGKTSLNDVLDWFGPPSLIVDGRKEVIDYKEFFVGTVPGETTIPTRTIESPDGTVICIYRESSHGMTARGMTSPVGAAIHDRTEVRSDELFIYVRKRDWIVVDVMSGLANEQGDGT